MYYIDMIYTPHIGAYIANYVYDKNIYDIYIYILIA